MIGKDKKYCVFVQLFWCAIKWFFSLAAGRLKEQWQASSGKLEADSDKPERLNWSDYAFCRHKKALNNQGFFCTYDSAGARAVSGERDHHFGVRFRIAQRGKGLRDTLKLDRPGDQGGGFELTVGQGI